MGRGDDEPVFDDDFVRAAAIREDEVRGALPKPSKESLREVKREAKARKRSPGGYGGPGAYAGAEPYARRSGGRLRRATGALAVIAVGGAAVWGFSLLPEPSRAAGQGPATEQQPVVVPSYTPSPTPPAKTDPFAGTSVESWPVGAQGVRPPGARATGAFSSRQVAKAYAATAAFVRAGMLDRRVLYGGQREPVLATMRRSSADHWRRQDFGYVGTRFRPEIAAASPIVKVNGRMTARPARGEVLLVDFSYVAVYALRPAADRAAPAELVTIRRYGVVEFSGDSAAGVTLPGVRTSTYLSSHASCGTRWPHRHYMHVRIDDEGPSDGPAASPGEELDLLDPDAPVPKGDCFENTGEL